MRRRIEEKPVFWYNTLMSVNDLTNLGIEADMPEELRRFSATTEHQALLQHFGIADATLNGDVWAPAEQLRMSQLVAVNIADRIVNIRGALNAVQLTALLNPRIQAAVATVARHAPGSAEARQSVSAALAQAVYDALPKEILHQVMEQEIINPLPGYRAAYTVDEQNEARKFYEKLRAENDANDMVAGMAMFMAMHDGTSNPVATPAIPPSLGPPPTPAIPARQSWEQKYIVNNTETVSRKNVAETVLDFKTAQAIVLPPGIPPNATQVEVQNIVNEMNVAGGTYAQLDDAINRQNRADNNHRRLTQTYETEVVAWEQRKAVHDAAVQAYNQEWATYHRELGTRGMTPTRPTTTNPGAFPEVRPAKPTARAFRRFTLTGAFAANIGTIEEAHAKLAELRTTERALQGAINEFTARHTKINALIALLQALNIQNIPATFPTLASICTAAPLALDPASFPANFNYAALATEIERNFPNGLKSVDEYSKEVVEAGKKKPSGLDLSKSVIRSYVKTERPSLSAGDIESVSNYIVNRTKVDGILRSSVEQGVDEYLNVNNRSMMESVSNRTFAHRHFQTVNQIGRSMNLPMVDQQPNWQAASYEQASAAYFAIKELVDGKGPADLRMTARPQVAVDAMSTLSRILTTKYAGQMEAKLLASLPDDQKKDVTRSRARLAQEVQNVLTGDTPDWVKKKVAAAHARADSHSDWLDRGAYNLTTGALTSIGTNVGSWIGTGASNGWSGATSAVSHYGADAAKIAAFSFIGGPVLGIAAWYAMKHFEKPSSAKE